MKNMIQKITKVILFLAIINSNNAFGQKNIAKAAQIGSVYVFTDCTPLSKYEVLGDISFGGGNSSVISLPNGMGGQNMIITGSTPQYTSIRNGLVANALMANKTVEGIIISIPKEGEGRATMIKFTDESEDKSLCKVNRQQGLYVFCDNKPTLSYDILGEIVGAGGLSSYYNNLRNKLIKKALRKYKTADGIILNLVEGGRDRAEAIQLE